MVELQVGFEGQVYLSFFLFSSAEVVHGKLLIRPCPRLPSSNLELKKLVSVEGQASIGGRCVEERLANLLKMSFYNQTLLDYLLWNNQNNRFMCDTLGKIILCLLLR